MKEAGARSRTTSRMVLNYTPGAFFWNVIKDIFS